MPAVPANAPSSTTTSSKPDGPDYEPDEEWKLQLRKRIEEGLQSMVADAKESQATELRNSPHTPETRLRLEASYKQVMQTIKGLATEQYQLELDRERNQRRWTAGVPMNPGWTQYFREEQQNIMNSIKQSSNQTDNSARTASESPTEERRSAIPKTINEPPAPAPPPVLMPVPPNPSPRPTEEREKSFFSPQSVRRGSDARSTLSRDRDEHPGSFRRSHHASVHERPALPDNWVTPDTVEDPEEIIRPPLLPRTRLSSIDRPSQPSPVSPDRWDGSIGRSSGSIHSTDRHPARSPTRPHPEVRKPKPPPYYEYRDQTSPRDSYPHRDQQIPSQDQPNSARPIPVGPSYGGDDREYGSPYSRPKPSYHPQRDSRPISRQASFTRPPYLDLDDDDDDRDMDRGGRDRERPWDRDYERDRDRDGGRDVYTESRRGTAYSYSTPRHSPYPNPPPGGPRPAPQEYVNMSDFYDDRSEGAAGPSRSRNNYRSLPPDDWEYQRPPDNTRSTPSRQGSYVRPRDDVDRRFSTENDGYSRHYSQAGGIPIPRHTPSFDEQPAWRDWAAEGNRHPIYDYPQQARSPSNAESFSHRRFPQPPPSYHNSPHDDQPSFGGRETDSSYRGNSTVTNEYESEEVTDSEDDDDDISEEGMEAKRLRDLEAKKQKLEEERREADNELKRTEAEIQRLATEETRKKKEEEEKRNEEERKAEEARRREEDARKKEEEVRRKEEEVKKKEEEAAKKEEEAKRMEEEAKKKEEEAKRKEEEAKRKEREAKKKEVAAKRKEDEAKRKAEELSKKEEETKQRAAQLEADAERTKQMHMEAQKIAEEALKKQEDLKKMEEDARKKDMEMKEREDILHRREEELMRREAENFRREEEAKKKEEEAKQKEAAAREEVRKEEARKREESRKEEARRKEAKKREEAKKEEARREEARREEARREEARKEEARKEETRKEEARKEEARKEEARKEEARKEEFRQEEAKKKEEAQRKEAKRNEEAKKKAAEKKKEEEARREEDIVKRKLQAEEAKRKADEAAKENSRREEARLEGFRREQEEKRREQEEKRLQNESQHLNDMLYDLDSTLVDPKLMEEQYKVLQQAEFRKREEDIRRTREERKRNDSVGNDNAWSSPSYLSASPGTSPSISRTPPQFNGPPIPERSAGPSSWGAGAAPAWSSSIKPTAPPSPAANRASASAPTGKPRTGSVSSGTFPMSSPPHTTSFTEAERTRKQQEFAESQQEQFRCTQEKLEAERQLKSSGRPLSREELQRVFEHHERLWNRLNSLSDLSWNDFPWPIARAPSNPDDMSLPLISAYIQSPAYPDKDKTRTPKDRIKEHIKRWHPDRFETKLLPKVVEEEREKVKHGAGNVARYLSDLLRKENESNNNIFGD